MSASSLSKKSPSKSASGDDFRVFQKASSLRSQGNLVGAARVIAPLARRPRSLTPQIQKFILRLIGDIYLRARREYRRGNVRRASSLLLAIKEFPWPYARRARFLLHEIRYSPRRLALVSWKLFNIESLLGMRAGGRRRARRKRLSPRPRALRPKRGISFRPRRRGTVSGSLTHETELRVQRPVPPTERILSAVRDSTVRRTPHMSLTPNEPLQPDSEFRVYVYADQQQPQIGEESWDIIIRAPEQVSKFKVDTRLIASAHFSIIGDAAGQLIIRRQEPTTNKAEFVLRVAGANKLPNTQPTITALFQYQGRPSGKVTRKLKIEGVVPKSPEKSTRRLAFSGEVLFVPERPEALPTMDVQHEAVMADLTISVLESEEKDGRHFKMIVDARPIKAHWEGPWVLPQKTDVIVNGAMTTFTNPGKDAIGRISALKGAGIEMFAATPPEFQRLFWEMVDAKKLPKSILVISEEPYIPWELMVPQRRVDTRLETREAIGTDFAIGRWITDKYVSPPQKIALKQTYVVAPNYPPGRQLPTAPIESKFVCDSFTPSATIQPANVNKIDKTLKASGATLIHFVCHGQDGFPQTISLENDQDRLNCWQVKALKGFLDSFQKVRTFVFLNACEVGRQSPSLVGIGGFGNSFVEIGSSAVVAPLWSVDDRIAHKVAMQFYRGALQSPRVPFAEVLRRIRKHAYSRSAEDTWAAYCFYGDPLACRS